MQIYFKMEGLEGTAFFRQKMVWIWIPDKDYNKREDFMKEWGIGMHKMLVYTSELKDNLRQIWSKLEVQVIFQINK